MDLVDLLVGVEFTWTNKQDNLAMSRLDRFLVSPKWDDHFTQVDQVVSPNPVSDHLPMLLKTKELRNRPSPFWVELMWLEVEGFKNKIRSWWESYFHGTASYVFAQKLKALIREDQILELC